MRGKGRKVIGNGAFPGPGNELGIPGSRCAEAFRCRSDANTGQIQAVAIPAGLNRDVGFE